MYSQVGPHLRTLPNKLNAMRADDLDESSDSEEDEDPEELYTSSNSDARKFEVRDMLSVFDSETFPQNYGTDFVNLEPGDVIDERLWRSSNLAETIYNLAVQNETFYKELRKVLSHNLCADMSFIKHNLRVQRITDQLDAHIREGPTASTAADPPRGGRQMTVVECACQLRRIAAAIFRERSGRVNQYPYLALEALIKVSNTFSLILKKVCERDQDVYRSDTPPWSRLANPANESAPRERNLFLYLIGDPPATQQAECFIVDYFARIPSSEWAHLHEDLAQVSASARRTGTERGHAHALIWADRMDDLLQDAVAAADAAAAAAAEAAAEVHAGTVVESVERPDEPEELFARELSRTIPERRSTPMTSTMEPGEERETRRRRLA